jgi:hypothetical protein
MIAVRMRHANNPLSLHPHLPERSSPSRVRSAAQNRRALDRSGPFRKFSLDKGNGGQCKVKTASLHSRLPPPVGRPPANSPPKSQNPRPSS